MASTPLKNVSSKKPACQNTFEAVALEWHEQNKDKWSDNYAKTIMHRMKRNLFPQIGSKPVHLVSAPELLALLRKIEARGAKDIPHIVRSISSSVFRYAIATGRRNATRRLTSRGRWPRASGGTCPRRQRPGAVGH